MKKSFSYHVERFFDGACPLLIAVITLLLTCIFYVMSGENVLVRTIGIIIYQLEVLSALIGGFYCVIKDAKGHAGSKIK